MKFFSFLILISISSCMNRVVFEKDYYEKISGIKFPLKYKVLETFDNGEWLTGTVFKIDNLFLKEFVRENHFGTLRNINDIHLQSESYLIGNKPDTTTVSNVYFIRKSSNKNNWIYLVDLNNNKLWAEISYPDGGGQ